MEILRRAEYAPALSTSPRRMRTTATTTPPSMRCGSVSERRSPPSWFPSGTRTRRSPASSTCSISVPSKCRISSGWRSRCLRIKPPSPRVQRRPQRVRGRDVRGLYGQVLLRRGLYLRRDDQGLRQGVRELSLFPVLCGSAVNCMGSLMLMDNIVDLLPNPMEGNYHKGHPHRRRDRGVRGLSRRRAYGLCL